MGGFCVGGQRVLCWKSMLLLSVPYWFQKPFSLHTKHIPPPWCNPIDFLQPPGFHWKAIGSLTGPFQACNCRSFWVALSIWEPRIWVQRCLTTICFWCLWFVFPVTLFTRYFFEIVAILCGSYMLADVMPFAVKKSKCASTGVAKRLQLRCRGALSPGQAKNNTPHLQIPTDSDPLEISSYGQVSFKFSAGECNFSCFGLGRTISSAWCCYVKKMPFQMVFGPDDLRKGQFAVSKQDSPPKKQQNYIDCRFLSNMMYLLKESCKLFGEVTVQGEKQTHSFWVLYSLALVLTGSVLIKMPTLWVPVQTGICRPLGSSLSTL